jgi:carboxylesterase type B
MAPEVVNLQHPAIGSIKGTSFSAEVEEYRGIKYATLADRFARGQLIESYSSDVDATSHGYVHLPPSVHTTLSQR